MQHDVSGTVTATKLLSVVACWAAAAADSMHSCHMWPSFLAISLALWLDLKNYFTIEFSEFSVSDRMDEKNFNDQNSTRLKILLNFCIVMNFSKCYWSSLF